MMSAKAATPGLLKLTVFWDKGYDVTIPVNDVINKILSPDSNYIVYLFMWPKLSQPQIYKNLTRKTAFFEGWSWFKLNNLGLALGTNLKFYTSVAKGLKLKVRKFLGPIPTFVEVTGGKLVGGRGLFAPPSSWIGLILTELANFNSSGNRKQPYTL